MSEQTLPWQAQVFLTATMHAVDIRCVDLGHVALPLHFTCSATLFLPFELRTCCDSAVDFTGKKVVSVVMIFKNEVVPDFYVHVTEQRISTSWDVCWDFSGARGELLGPLDLEKEVTIFELAQGLHRIVDWSMDLEVLTAKGQLPHDKAWRSLLMSTISVDSQLQSQAASETHVALFRPSWKRKPFLNFVFRVCSRRMFIWSQWCAWFSGFRREVTTAPSFLVAKPRVPVAKFDYAPGFFEPFL